MKPAPYAAFLDSPFDSFQWVHARAAEDDVLFFDSEFNRLPAPGEPDADWLAQLQILSIGLVALDDESAQAYARRVMSPQLHRECSPFVTRHVLPILDRQEETKVQSHQDFSRWIYDYLEKRRRASGKPPVLVLDWIMEALILRELDISVPLLMLRGLREWAKPDESQILGLGLVPHNALDDARATRLTSLRFF